MKHDHYDAVVTVRRRRQALLRRLRAENLSAMLVTKVQNVRYLSGFTGEDSWLLVAPSGTVLVTDGRFAEQAEHESPGIRHVIRNGSIVEATAQILKVQGVKQLAIEAGSVTVETHGALLKAARKTRLRPVSGWVEEMRAIKDEGEIEAIRRCIRMAQKGFRGMVGEVRPGRSERWVAGCLDWHMRQAGADDAAFDTICAFGARASLPHARPGSARLGRSGVMLVDWGARSGGYNCDLTRIIAMDRMPPLIRRIYETCLEAQRRAIARAGPGVPCSEVDAAARSYIAERGYGDAFNHGTGHGVGLEVHEAPTLSRLNTRSLSPGMVVTVEPGIYLPGTGGVRIEDMVLITREGREVLTGLGTGFRAVEGHLKETN